MKHKANKSHMQKTFNKTTQADLEKAKASRFFEIP